MSFTVGQLAKLTGLTVRALHHYDAIGLLVPSQRSDAGYRLYTQVDIVKLYRIQALQRFGLSLAEIETALKRDGATLPEMISQQLAALNDQIEQASALRSQLQHLRGLLTRGDEPAAGEWLAAVELITQYDKHFSPEELARLVENNIDQSAWRLLLTDIQTAMDGGVDPQSEQARTLLNRWATLVMRRAGGDTSLLVKLKLAHAKDPEIQARMEIGGMTPKLGEYVGQVMMQAHLALWSRYLAPDEVQRLQPHGDWHPTLLRVNGALRHEMNCGASSNSDAVRTAIDAWDSLVDMFVAGDANLRNKVLAALRSDVDLQWNWILTPDLQKFMDHARIENHS